MPFRALILHPTSSFFQFDSLECLSLLLDVGHCDPTRQDHRGNTALHIAFVRKLELIINKLLDSGADPDIANNDGVEALQGFWLVNTTIENVNKEIRS